MRKKANCRCTLKGLVDLKLDDTKKNLMKNSQFYQFLNVKDKATSSFLVHKFLQCYKVAEKHFEVNQNVVTIDVSDIVRMTGLKASGDQYEKSKSQNIPSWYVDLVDKYPPPTKEKKAEKKKKEEDMEEKEEEKEEKKEEEKEEEEEEEEKGKGEAEKKRTHKSTVSHVLRGMHVDTEEDQENFKKLLCYFLICFYVDAPAEDIRGYHHFVDVDDLRKFEKICWAQVMLCNILDCAEKISSQSNRSYITCNSPVVEMGWSTFGSITKCPPHLHHHQSASAPAVAVLLIDLVGSFLALVYDKLPDMFEVQARDGWKEGDIIVNKFEEKLWSNKSVMGHFAGENTTSFLHECIDDELILHPDVLRSDLIRELKVHYFIGEASDSDLLLKLVEVPLTSAIPKEVHVVSSPEIPTADTVYNQPQDQPFEQHYKEQNKTEKKRIRGDSARKLIARIKATDDDDDDDDEEEEEEEEEEEGGGHREEKSNSKQSWGRGMHDDSFPVNDKLEDQPQDQEAAKVEPAQTKKNQKRKEKQVPPPKKELPPRERKRPHHLITVMLGKKQPTKTSKGPKTKGSKTSSLKEESSKKEGGRKGRRKGTKKEQKNPSTPSDTSKVITYGRREKRQKKVQ
ncbi:hypothetical protein RDABS01_024471 [Bienertia sinuspersici]